MSSRGAQLLLLSDNSSGTGGTTSSKKPSSETRTLSVSYDLIGQDMYLISGASDADKEVGGAEPAALSSRDSTVDKYSKITSSIGFKILADGDCAEVLHFAPLPSVDITTDRVPALYAQVNAAKGRDASSPPSGNDTTKCEEGPSSCRKDGEMVLTAENDMEEGNTECQEDTEGFYDLLVDEEEPTGLTRVESMKSIEMLVTDMCKSLEEEGGVASQSSEPRAMK